MAMSGDHDAASDRQFGGRIRRYAKVTSTMGGLAARVAGERYLGWEIDRGKHAADLRQALGGLKGPIMKVAQFYQPFPMRCHQICRRAGRLAGRRAINGLAVYQTPHGGRAWC